MQPFWRPAAFVLLLLVSGLSAQTSRASADLVSSLPGVTFQVSFNQYAGYLKSDPSLTSADLHYWYIEAQTNPQNATLLVYFNGGPGCSSVFGLLEEIGPFRVNADSQTLYENVFAWNKVSNLLVIDAPGVGYSSPYSSKQTDDTVSNALLNALIDFYSVFPTLLSNDLYLTGEGYASFFVSNIAYSLLVNKQPAPLTQPVKFKGLVLANGVLSAKHQFNTIIPYAYTHAFAGKDQWNDLRSVCCKNTSTLDCDFYGNANADCITKAQNAVQSWISNQIDPANIYQDCYRELILLNSTATILGLQLGVVNYNSTDPMLGYPCRSFGVTQAYLNRQDVRNALHVTSTNPYQSCSTLNYGDLSTDLYLKLASIITNANYAANQNKILIYNGDLDVINNFVAAQKFGLQLAESLGLNQTEDRIWRANYDSAAFKWMDGGVVTKYTSDVHILSIRGAGHFAPQSRPSQTLQVIRDFINDLYYNNCLSRVDKVAKPLLPQYQQAATAISRKAADKIVSLPGVTFALNFNQYSGYLNASETHKFHYWFVESQSNPSTDPVLLWLNGGPGSSSVWGMLTENGPFRPNKDGQTLYENIHSWNRFANVLYLESPHQVGFSYSTTPNDYTYNDDLTANNNYNSLVDFFTNVFPEYQNNPFYITGESYGGVYIPTLSKLLIDKISQGAVSVNFKGIAIGNGELTTKLQVNSVIFQLYTYGLLGQKQYDELVSRCCQSDVTDSTQCDFYTPYIYFDELGNYKPVSGADKFCSDTVLGIAGDMVWTSLNDPYNIYQDCYTSDAQSSLSSRTRQKRVAVDASFSDNAGLLNLDSSDPFNGFPCWGDAATAIYLNRQDVRTALHIPDFVQQWQSFNQTVNENLYKRSYFEMDTTLQYIISTYYYNVNNMSILIYNGDVDMVCNHLGDQWLIEGLASNYPLKTTQVRTPWFYSLAGTNNYKQVAGFQKVFEKNIHLVTVKGSGHLVPQDRPGPALQMIYNFVKNLHLNTTYPSLLTPKPLLSSFTSMNDCQAETYPDAKTLPTLPPYPPLPPGITLPFGAKAEQFEEEKREKRSVPQPETLLNTNTSFPTNLTQEALNDMILTLPGLTWNVTYRMFSGYITPPEHPKNHFFYWFTESQNDPVNDPVVLWLNGGPGCSSLGGFFTELGPFHPNDDGGQTLYENVFSWNKRANVIFLEAPVNVGFSKTDDANYIWNDDTTAENNAYAVKAFFETKFPQYAQNQFFITGESYGGVYCPTLALWLVQLIDSKSLNLNFKGVAVGNGILSEYLQTNSEFALQYGRGINGIDDWNTLKQSCNLTGVNATNPVYYDYSNTPAGSDCDDFSNYLLDHFYDTVYGNWGDPYNIYQDCYLDTIGSDNFNEDIDELKDFGLGKTSRRRLALLAHRRRSRTSTSQYAAKFQNNYDKSWYGSTDAFRGLNCFGGDAMTTYLRRADVQAAIHADSPYKWRDCRSLGYHTQEKYYDMINTISAIMDSNWYSKNNMRLMFYNGDIDTICQFLGDQWLIENLVTRRNLSIVYDRQPWTYQKSAQYAPTLAGYAKAWSQNIVQLTVKGSGHFVPADRPAQALQMLQNFLINQNNYSTPANIDVTPSTLFPEYTSTVNCTRSQSDRVLSLPGLPADMQFKQYSGFLDGTAGHKVHYWLVESENNPSTDPLILWLNGGPGSSSLMGLFEENGPFRVSKDGQTLSRNPYSWNKFANVLYLESPVGVGYSYSTDGVGPTYDDNSTAAENYIALVNFFKLFPEYTTRPFYTTGESYAGVYLPTLSNLLVMAIRTGNLSINYKGVAIGNGVLDKKADMNSLFHFHYYHGGITYSQYKTAIALCCPEGDEFNCPLSSHFSIWNNSVPYGNLSDPCYGYALEIGTNLLLNAFDPYNLYQQCWTLVYNDTTPATPYGETWTGINYDSTDPYNAYPCYMDDAMQTYLNLPGVRSALNIPASVGTWLAYNNIINAYTQQVDTTSSYFSNIIANAPSGFQILIYNGDVDTMCNWLAAEWFTNDYFGNALGLQVANSRQPWTYQLDNIYYSTLAGYYKTYQSNDIKIDVMTIKGSGHFVPLDRPAQSLQMIYNWVNKIDYSAPFPSDNNGQTSTTASSATTTTTSGSTNTAQTGGSTGSSSKTTSGTSTTTVPATTQGTSTSFTVFSILIAIVRIYL